MIFLIYQLLTHILKKERVRMGEYLIACYYAGNFAVVGQKQRDR